METQSNNNHRSGSRNVLPGLLLVALGGLFLVGQLLPNRFSDAIIPIVILSGIGLTFFSVYLTNRRHWWALIPGYVLFAVAGIIVLSDILQIDGQLIGSYVMFAIAFPFLYVFLHNRQNWWALIPAGVMSTIGVGLLLDIAGSFITAAIPALMIAGGIYMLVRGMGRSEQKSELEREMVAPLTGPDTDIPR
jgi:uncharacterized membrane protein YfcA